LKLSEVPDRIIVVVGRVKGDRGGSCRKEGEDDRKREEEKAGS
jgi:hypothetical protein